MSHDDKGTFTSTRAAKQSRSPLYVHDERELVWHFGGDADAELGIRAIDNEAMMSRPRRQRFMVVDPGAGMLVAAARQRGVRQALRALTSRQQAILSCAYTEGRGGDDPALRATYGAAAGVVARAARAEAEAEDAIVYAIGWAKRRGTPVEPLREELRALRVASPQLAEQAVAALRAAHDAYLGVRRLDADESKFAREARQDEQSERRQELLAATRPPTGVAALERLLRGQVPPAPASRRRVRATKAELRDRADRWLASVAQAASGERFASDDWG